MDRSHNHFRIWATATDITTGASDAGYTVVDAGTIPMQMTSDFDYYVTQTLIVPHTVSDEFHYKVVVTDSNKATPVAKGAEMDAHTGAAFMGAEPPFDHNPPIKVVYSTASSMLGFSIDFGDSDASAGFQMSGYKVRK